MGLAVLSPLETPSGQISQIGGANNHLLQGNGANSNIRQTSKHKPTPLGQPNYRRQNDQISPLAAYEKEREQT
jgi:hypothetical protein